MVQATDIREHMEVVGSDGIAVGRVDKVEGGRIKLTRSDSADGAHHYLPLSAVSRVDSRVHLSMAAAAALASASAAGSAGVAGSAANGEHGPLPPVKNRAVEDARPRGNFYLPWIVGIVGLILLFLLFRSCAHRDQPPPPAPATVASDTAGNTPALPVEAVALPNGQSVQLQPNTFNYELQRYLASDQPAPRTFQFDKLNFDTGSAAIRPQDQANVDALAQILAAYPRAVVKVVGYTDARGSAPANDQLGQQRADAVAQALTAKGVDKARVQPVSGGEGNATDTNATAQGRFKNRRTELVVTGK